MNSNTPPRTRILLIDDSPVSLSGLAVAINQQREYDLCAIAHSEAEAQKLITEHTPDLLVVEISLRGANGITLLKNIAALAPKTPILIVSSQPEALYAERAVRAGARGYITKGEPLEAIVGATRRVLHGEVVLSPAMQQRLVQRLAVPGGAEGADVESLTDREMEVFTNIGNGMSTRQIAEKMGLSIKTIDSYREHMKQKLGIATGVELAQRAVQFVHSNR